MFENYPHKSVKEIIHDWAFDIVGQEETLLPIVNELLGYFKNITGLWKDNKAYQDLSSEIMLAKIDCELFGNFNQFLKFINSSEYPKKLNMLIAQKYDPIEAVKLVIKHFAIRSGLEIHEQQAFQAFLKSYNKYERALRTLEGVKTSEVVEHYEIVYQNCRLINLIRKKNANFADAIGQAIYLEKILGTDGINLSNRDIDALNYIFSLESEQDILESRKGILEVKSSGRK